MTTLWTWPPFPRTSHTTGAKWWPGSTYIRACRHIDGYNGPNWIIQRPSPLGRGSRRWSARTSASGNSAGNIITLEFDEAVKQTIADLPFTPPSP